MCSPPEIPQPRPAPVPVPQTDCRVCRDLTQHKVSCEAEAVVERGSAGAFRRAEHMKSIPESEPSVCVCVPVSYDGMMICTGCVYARHLVTIGGDAITVTLMKKWGAGDRTWGV